MGFVVVVLCDIAVDCIMTSNMPIKLTATPMDFFQVMGSFSTMAAMNMVIIGVMVLVMERSKGEAIVIATRNVICVAKSPSMLAKIMLSKSLGATFSLGVKIEKIQKRRPAPSALKVNKAIGGIPPALAISLQKRTLMPKMAYAAKHARCPISVLLPFIARN